jgi:hypothetical protein
MTTAMDKDSPEAQAQRLERAGAQLAALLQTPQVAQRLRAANASDWSALQVIGHVIEMIPYWLRQCQLLIDTQGVPPRFGRTLEDSERLAGVARGAAGDTVELVRVLDSEVQDAARAIRGMSQVMRGKVGIHVRQGEITVQQIIETFIVAHAEDHLAQVRAALQLSTARIG